MSKSINGWKRNFKNFRFNSDANKEEQTHRGWDTTRSFNFDMRGKLSALSFWFIKEPKLDKTEKHNVNSGTGNKFIKHMFGKGTRLATRVAVVGFALPFVAPGIVAAASVSPFLMALVAVPTVTTVTNSSVNLGAKGINALRTLKENHFSQEQEEIVENNNATSLKPVKMPDLNDISNSLDRVLSETPAEPWLKDVQKDNVAFMPLKPAPVVLAKETLQVQMGVGVTAEREYLSALLNDATVEWRREIEKLKMCNKIVAGDVVHQKVTPEKAQKLRLTIAENTKALTAEREALRADIKSIDEAKLESLKENLSAAQDDWEFVMTKLVRCKAIISGSFTHAKVSPEKAETLKPKIITMAQDLRAEINGLRKEIREIEQAGSFNLQAKNMAEAPKVSAANDDVVQPVVRRRFSKKLDALDTIAIREEAQTVRAFTQASENVEDVPAVKPHYKRVNGVWSNVNADIRLAA